jgi:hypothetical protein
MHLFYSLKIGMMLINFETYFLYSEPLLICQADLKNVGHDFDLCVCVCLGGGGVEEIGLNFGITHGKVGLI